MRVLLYYLFFLLLLVSEYRGLAQTPPKNPSPLDSLSRELAVARDDTTKIRLRYLAGTRVGILTISYWNALLADTRKYDLSLYTCRVLRELGKSYRVVHKYEKALSCLEEANKLSEQLGYDAETIELLKEQIAIHLTGVKGHKALELCHKGLKLSEALHHKSSEAHFYSSIGVYYYFLGDITKALEIQRKSLEIRRGLRDTSGIMEELIDIGCSYEKAGELDKASDYYLSIKKYYPRFGASFQDAYAYNAIASGYCMKKQYDSAYKYSYKSYLVYGMLHQDKGRASTLSTIARILLGKGDTQQAELLALKGLTLSRSTGFTPQVANCLIVLKDIYIKKQDYKKALEAYSLSIATRDSMANETNRKQALQKEFDYVYEKKVSENALLAKENQIQTLKLKQNKTVFAAFGALLLSIAGIGYLLIRQSKLRSQQQSMLLEQKVLRAQMNPHFIFNSLNSIQQFIIGRQNEPAELYLSKFSKLVRELLESNIRENLSVKEEVDLLNGYIEMESLRFSKAFSWSIHIAQDIKPEQLYIPHMMVQPFVENAIWHGLLPKEGDRQLLISFEGNTGGTLRCIVDDNGVGRESSMKKQNAFRKKSMALTFIRQRIDLMRKTLKKDCSIDVIDKADADGLSTGTRIIIVLPILNT